MKTTITRRAFIAGALSTVAALTGPELRQAGAVSGAAQIDASAPRGVVLPAKALRGYGTVSATFRPGNGANGPVSVTHIVCESPQKALLLQAKYLSDLDVLPGVADAAFTVGSGSVQAKQTSLGPAMVTCTVGDNVVILSASSLADLAALCVAALPHELYPSSFTARVKVPMYLDRFDRYGVLSYYAPFTLPPGHKKTDPPYNFSNDFDFAADNDLGLILWAGLGANDTAEGATNRVLWEWAADECRSRGVPLHLNTSWGSALWMTNRYRNQTMQKMPEYIGSYYAIDDPFLVETGSVSYNATTAEDAEMGILQETVKRFAPDPNIVGWLEPHGETDSPPNSLLVEYGPVADQSYRRFLQNRYASVSALSVSWFGASETISDWEQVKVPELASFLGWSEDALDLSGEWQVSYLPEMDEKAQPDVSRSLNLAEVGPKGWDQVGFDDSAWGRIVMPGNQGITYLQKLPMYARRTVQVPANWLASNNHAWLYLWDLNRTDIEHLPVSVNGTQTAGFHCARNAAHSGVIEITELLKPGANLIALCLPLGFIGYRCYISAVEPVQYPMLGRQRNAQWVDFMDWSRWSRLQTIRRGAEMIRQIDPERPINFMHPDFYSDHIKDLCADYGGQFHNTGYMGVFWADFNPLICRSTGRPATAEPGSPARSAEEFMSFWGRWITEGCNGVHYFLHLGDIMWNPAILQAFSDYRLVYETIGKYHVPKAETAILYGLRNCSLTGWPWGLDPNINLSGGYWAWNTASPLLDVCPRDGVTESDFGNGIVDGYLLIIDSNTSTMDEALVANIERWVRNGGIFVTFIQTGRHTPLIPNSWPISRLTGYDVTAISKYDVNGVALDSSALHLAPEQTVFAEDPRIAGVKASGLSLKKRAPECQDLLLWADGSVAAGVRPLGQGQIIQLGCHFENIHDRETSPATQALLEQIVDHYNIERVPGRADGVVFRHFISNNGLHDIWVLYNDTSSTLTTDLIFTADVPASALDIRTHQPVEITRSQNEVGIKGIELVAFDMKMFQTPRKDVTQSPLEWLTVQRNWWAGAKVPDRKVLPSPADDRRNSLDLSEDWAFKPADDLSDVAIAALTASGADDSGWERRMFGVWSLPDHPSVKHAILRRQFTIPPGWKDGETQLWVQGWHPETFLDQGRIFLDNATLLDFDRNGLAGVSMTDKLAPGSSHTLVVEIKGAGSLCGPTGNAWIYHIPEPSARMDLSGAWNLVDDGIHVAGVTSLPGPVAGMFAARTAKVDAAQANRDAVIYLKVEGPVYGMLVNGKMFARHHHMIGNTFLLNVTDHVSFGEENQFELVSREASTNTVIHTVELRFYDRDVYS